MREIIEELEKLRTAISTMKIPRSSYSELPEDCWTHYNLAITDVMAKIKRRIELHTRREAVHNAEIRRNKRISFGFNESQQRFWDNHKK